MLRLKSDVAWISAKTLSSAALASVACLSRFRARCVVTVDATVAATIVAEFAALTMDAAFLAAAAAFFSALRRTLRSALVSSTSATGIDGCISTCDDASYSAVSSFF